MREARAAAVRLKSPTSRRSPNSRPACHRAGAQRAHRSLRAAARVPLARRERETTGGRRPMPCPRRPCPWAGQRCAPQAQAPAVQQAPRLEQPQQPVQLPALHDSQQHGERCVAVCCWVGALEQRRPAAAAHHLAAAHEQPQHLAADVHEHLEGPSAVVVPPRRRGGRSRAAGRT